MKKVSVSKFWRRNRAEKDAEHAVPETLTLGKLKASGKLTEEGNENKKAKSEYLFENQLNESDDTPAVKLLKKLLMTGYEKGASDIHVEPWEEELVIRMRVDGLLAEFIRLEKDMHQPLVTCAKILSGMDIAEKRLPQDGHCKTVIQEVEMNIRTSSVPTIYGEKIVLRLLNMETKVDRAEMFGMDEDNYRKVMEILRSPNGIVYFTGPTGSGKTTTLYMILEWLKKQPVNIMTIEDPVEKNIAGISQIQINEQAGLTFEKGLRAILRQDPDVIMVGETRDDLTAEISVRAAITGHLVLSTLHTRNAVGAIVRMMDMKVEPYKVANSLSGVVAQRLARKVCPDCAKEVEISEEKAGELGLKVTKIRRGTGCKNCDHTGYKGRIAIHEVIVIDKEIREMIVERRTMEEILEYVKRTQNLRTLKEDLIHLVEQGVTTVDELVRLTHGE